MKPTDTSDVADVHLPRRVEYLVSRFPTASETFVVREMNAVAEVDPSLRLGLRSLFPPTNPLVHPSAERWLPELRRPTSRGCASAVARWSCRRPREVAGMVRDLIRAYARRPALLGRNLLGLAVGMAHAVELERAGVAHVHAHFAAYPALAAWAIKRLTGIGYSFTAHAYDIFLDQRMLPAKTAAADFVVAISEFNREFMAPYRGSTPIHVIHCGVDPAAYAYRPRTLGTAPCRLLCVASLQEKKGHRTLLEALAHGGTDLDEVELDLVGGGELREELEEVARELGLSSRVRFHGSLGEDAVREMLERADAFVLPSVIASDGQMEGIPVALMEAMASGLPVVASRISGIPELIDDGRTGLLAEQGDPADLAAALRRLITGPPLDLQAAREKIERDFDIHETGRRMAALLDPARG